MRTYKTNQQQRNRDESENSRNEPQTQQNRTGRQKSHEKHRIQLARQKAYREQTNTSKHNINP